MADQQDALSQFDFSKVTSGGLFLKWKPGVSQTLRVLTVDPVVTNESFEDRKTGEEVVSTKFSFVVYNWTEKKAQILKATANMAKQIGDLHADEDFGANIQKVDLKITPPEKGEIKAYEIQVLPKANDLIYDIIKECQAIDLDEKVENGQRMSFYDPDAKSGYEKAKEVRDTLPGPVAPEPGEALDKPFNVTEEDLQKPINLDDIPF